MTGTAANAHLWADADVYVSFDLAAATPANEGWPFSAAWIALGLLNGDNGFEFERAEDVNDHFAWGGILMKTSRKNFKQTVKFGAFESNATTHKLMWPGSTGSTLIVPTPVRCKVAFETREGTTTHRLISYYQAEIAPDGTVKKGEANVAEIPFVATIYPDGNGNLWTEQPNQVGS